MQPVGNGCATSIYFNICFFFVAEACIGNSPTRDILTDFFPKPYKEHSLGAEYCDPGDHKALNHRNMLNQQQDGGGEKTEVENLAELENNILALINSQLREFHDEFALCAELKTIKH